MVDLLTASLNQPGLRELSAIFAVTLRHFPDDASVSPELAALGLAWPLKPGQMVGSDPWLVWRGPQEALLLSTQRHSVDRLLSALAPGLSPTALAAELSDSLMTCELHGPRLDDWLGHLVDASSIPRQAGSASRARLADVAVLLLRLDAQRLWLMADRSISAYVINWLGFSHEGAFGTPGSSA